MTVLVPSGTRQNSAYRLPRWHASRQDSASRLPRWHASRQDSASKPPRQACLTTGPAARVPRRGDAGRSVLVGAEDALRFAVLADATSRLNVTQRDRSAAVGEEALRVVDQQRPALDQGQPPERAPADVAERLARGERFGGRTEQCQGSGDLACAAGRLERRRTGDGHLEWSGHPGQRARRAVPISGRPSVRRARDPRQPTAGTPPEVPPRPGTTGAFARRIVPRLGAADRAGAADRVASASHWALTDVRG